ncbi:NAD(P)H-dependent oxidoreductase [Candidatus Falkowbacteria bacterium]|nr:NAD(P)H-dependent oxidoreductase [Candidatus Falkowbacteria bacterium]
MAQKMWVCNNCGFIHSGDQPPKNCPRCGSEAGEFNLMPVKPSSERAKALKPTDYLIINGSKHRAHNTRLFTDMVAEVFKEQKKSYQVINLSEYRVDLCWHCYSMFQNLCHDPCQNQDDDMKYFYSLLKKCKGFIIVSPINWNNMSALLKHFLDRLTAIQNMFLVNGTTPMLGKTCGIIINGHEDGAYKTAFDILMYLENMGCVLAPYGITYTTHGAQYKTEEDKPYFKADKKTREFVRAVANNVIKFSEMKFNYKKNIIPACE